jgi:hypothetical protein
MMDVSGIQIEPVEEIDVFTDDNDSGSDSSRQPDESVEEAEDEEEEQETPPAKRSRLDDYIRSVIFYGCGSLEYKGNSNSVFVFISLLTMLCGTTIF